ncbi:MAG: VWA domain-containing protein [Oscillospiraceae bacterium]|nr:VWA domain-containing protein [Oscillospiraceae bacterium]
MNEMNYPQTTPETTGHSMDYTVDMVFCIDATGSMEDVSGSQTKIINMVKQNAMNFYNDFIQIMHKKQKRVHQLRVRVVVFRDYIADKENAMMVTDFFLLPQQTAEFEACIRSIHADGGGDIPEDGLEALAYAIKSKWNTASARGRQVIVVWTDAGTHELGYGRRSKYYPNGMPQNMSELNDWWDGMNSNSKRLVLFAPDENGWSYISQNWDNTVHIPSAAGNGLAEKSYNEILNAIANSV